MNETENKHSVQSFGIEPQMNIQTGIVGRRVERMVWAAVDAELPYVASIAEEDRSRIALEVSKSVFERMRLMPFFLRVPCYLLAIAFDMSSLLVCGKLFSNLDSDRRRTHMQIARRWPIVRFGELLKLTLSLMLLYYFDHPRVRHAIGYEWRTGVSEVGR
ncbi:MAG: hypothetical protein AB1473_14960 [Thermodesulfobacteriota bacterium]